MNAARTKSILVLVLLALLGGTAAAQGRLKPAPAPPSPVEPTTEVGRDRPGSDYKGFDLTAADPKLCRQACQDDDQCRAYTYVQPGVQGPVAHCYLKHAVPAAMDNACCVSGVKPATPAQQATPRRGVSAPARQPPSVAAPVPGILRTPGIAKPVKPGPLGTGQAQGSLNGVHPKDFPKCQPGAESNAIFAVLGKLADWFGGDVHYDARCGNYRRELAAGVTLSAPVSAPNPLAWPQLGGSGDLMADALLCLIKDLGEAPGGRIVRKSPAEAGAGVAIEQVVGLSKFEPSGKRVEFYQQVRVCAPIVGCFDTQRQNLVATVRESVPAWPGGMRSGDYPIANSYSVEIAADWASTAFGASTPPITITTPYGSATLQPSFSFSSGLYPVDTPFAYKAASRLFLDHPGARQSDTPIAQDSYGRSGVPFILNLITAHQPPTADCSNRSLGTICPQAPDPAPPPAAWSSQVLFGARNGVAAVKPWNPGPGVQWPERPDLDTETPRSQLETTPTANFLAKSPVTIEPPMVELIQMIPKPVRSLLGSDGIMLKIVITPEFSADYAAQFGLFEREGRLRDCYLPTGEFGGPCGLAEAMLYAQSRVEGRMRLLTHIYFKIDFNWPIPDIDLNTGFPPIDLAGPDRDWDPPLPKTDPYANKARAALIAIAPAQPVGALVQGLSGRTAGDLRQWTQQCLTTPPKATSSLPEPSHQPGAPDDLEPELLPCNICIADSSQTSYAPFLFPDPPVTAKAYSKNWTCEWEGQLGCHDLCSWEKTADGGARFLLAVRSAVDVVGPQCQSKPPPVVK